MKKIYTNSFKKLARSFDGVIVSVLCDGCGNTISAELPDAIKQEQGEKDIYCNKCKEDLLEFQ